MVHIRHIAKTEWLSIKLLTFSLLVQFFLSEDPIRAQGKTFFTSNGRIEPPSSPPIVQYTTALHSLFMFRKTISLPLLPSLSLLFSLFPQPTLNGSLQIMKLYKVTTMKTNFGTTCNVQFWNYGVSMLAL